MPHAPYFYIPCALHAPLIQPPESHALPPCLYVLKCTYIPCIMLLYKPMFQCIPIFPYPLCPYAPLFAIMISVPYFPPYPPRFQNPMARSTLGHNATNLAHVQPLVPMPRAIDLTLMFPCPIHCLASLHAGDNIQPR